MNASRRTFRTVVAALVLLPCAAKAQDNRIKVLLLDGESGGPYHNWHMTTPILKKELEDTGLLNVTVLTAPAGNGDFSSFHPNFSQYQVVVSNLDSQDWPGDLKTSFETYVRDGGGFVVVHAADNAFPNWAAYNEMTGIGGWRQRNEAAGPRWYRKDGKLVSDATPAPAGRHGARLPFQVTDVMPDHPILKGLPPLWMHAPDELYGMMRGPGKNMIVLAAAHSDPNNKGTGFDEPMLIVLRYGKGRVFHTLMGHDAMALSCIGFTTTFQRGTEWAATGRVTQKVPVSFPTATTVSYSVAIAEMDPVIAKGTMLNPSAGMGPTSK